MMHSFGESTRDGVSPPIGNIDRIVLRLTKGGENMNELNFTEALLRAILELIEKCDTLEELRASVNKIMGK